jgi:hypothetical protein
MLELISLMNFSLLGAVTQFPRIWYVVPLIIAISLVYGATRHERTADIFKISLHTMIWIVGIGAVILGIVLLLGLWN